MVTSALRRRVCAQPELRSCQAWGGPRPFHHPVRECSEQALFSREPKCHAILSRHVHYSYRQVEKSGTEFWLEIVALHIKVSFDTFSLASSAQVNLVTA